VDKEQDTFDDALFGAASAYSLDRAGSCFSHCNVASDSIENGRKLSFISAYHDHRRGKVLVWERNEKGMRVKREFDPPFYFYVPDRIGDYESITGVRLKRETYGTETDFNLAAQASPYRYESDLEPVERVLMDEYSTKPVPSLKVGFIDIEVDYSPDIGFARTNNPYAPINAITVYFKDLDEYVTLAVPPKRWVPTELSDDLKHVTLCRDERELLETFLEVIHDIDVLSGWNSEFFDIPYIGKRVELVFGQHALSRLGLEDGPPPRWGERVKFKFGHEKDIILNLISRVHLDYLRLFKKFNLTTRKSFSLEAVGMDELKIPKLHYEGTLHELYNNNFFEFLRYNTHDVRLIKLLDDMYKYIDLANTMAHEAAVNFEAVFGSVQLIDTAIMCFAHNKLNKIVLDREIRPEAEPVEGAIVVTPDPGFYEWIAACDITSLYPSTIRSLNLSPEKLVGQLKRRHEVDPKVYLVPERKVRHEEDRKEIKRFGHESKWTRYIEADRSKLKKSSGGAPKDIFDFGCKDLKELTTYVYEPQEYAWLAYKDARANPDNEAMQNVLLDITIDTMGEKELMVMSTGELVKLCDEKKYSISGFGTIVDQGTGEGLVAAVLSYWFNGRKEMQASKKKHGIKKEALLKTGKAKDDPEVAEQARLEAYYDVLQGVRKVLLNSTYGAMLNEFCRFGDPRIGASVTFTGRQITQHMVNTVSKTLIPENSPELVKIFDPSLMKDRGQSGATNRVWGANYYEINCPPGLGPIYGDTDSVYFTMKDVVSSPSEAIEMADAIAEGINSSFPGFMRSAFNCQPSFDTLIRANRELVCRAGVIQAKKKYFMLVIDKEGKTIPPGHDDELKTMGSDIKISSTPQVIREMLTRVVMDILNNGVTDVNKKQIDEFIINFRSSLKGIGDDVLNPLDLSSTTSVRNLDEFTNKWQMIEVPGLGNAKLPSNARASINYNSLLDKLKLMEEPRIMDGNKILILWLKENDYGFTNIAFPSDFDELPKWFTDRFEVDTTAMELKLVDQKLQLIFDALDWEVPTVQSMLNNKLLEF